MPRLMPSHRLAWPWLPSGASGAGARSRAANAGGLRSRGLALVLGLAALFGPPTRAEPAGAPADEPVVVVDSDNYADRVVAPHRGRGLVVNFWATWCAPCLKEMPDLERALQDARKEGLLVDVVLVSADWGGAGASEKIRAQLAKRKVTLETFVKDETDLEQLTKQIDPTWMGSLPYTAVYDAKGKLIHRAPGSQTYDSFRELLAKAAPPPPKGKGRDPGKGKGASGPKK